MLDEKNKRCIPKDELVITYTITETEHKTSSRAGELDIILVGEL